MKVCTTCKIEKPLSEFPKLCKNRAHLSDGHQPQCKACRKAYRSTPEQRKLSNEGKKRSLLKPENLAKKKKRDRQYSQTEQGKEAHAKAQVKYKKTQNGKAIISGIQKKYRQTQKCKNAVSRSRLKFPERRKAGIIIMNALAYGKIIRPDHCSVCNKICVPEGHHPDYSKPLEVVWVCKDCHTAIHWCPAK